MQDPQEHYVRRLVLTIVDHPLTEVPHGRQ